MSEAGGPPTPPRPGSGRANRSGFISRAPGKRKVRRKVAMVTGEESLGHDSSNSACDSGEEQTTAVKCPRNASGSKRQRLAPPLTCVLCGEAGKDVRALPEDARGKLEALAASYNSSCQICMPQVVLLLKGAAEKGIDALQADGAANLGRHQGPSAGGGCKGWKQLAHKVNHSGACTCPEEAPGDMHGSAGSATLRFTGGASGPGPARVAPTHP